MNAEPPKLLKAATQSHWKADGALLVVALMWGTTFVIVKAALAEISTFYFLALRFSLATIFMLPLLLPVWRHERGRIWPGLRSGAIAGMFLWLGYVLQTFGLRYTTAGNSGFLTGLYVPLVPIIGAVVYRRKPQWAELIGIIVAAIGMAVIMAPPLNGRFQFNKGDVLTLACAIAFAFHLLTLSYFSSRHAFGAVAVGQIASTALLSFAALPFEPTRASWNGAVVGAILVTGIFATALAFTLQTWAQQYASVTRTAVILSLEPVFALATAILSGSQALTRAALIGGSFILAGILVVELKPFADRDFQEPI